MNKKTENIENLISFSIMDDYVESGNYKIYFYRFIPPNTSILTLKEMENEILALSNLFETANMELHIFAMDKVEDLKRNKEHFENMNEKYKRYTEQIVAQISSHDTDDKKTNSIQRAYYFIIKVKENSDRIVFEDALKSQRLKCKPVGYNEYITVFRNYYLREFSPFDILVFNEELKKQYGNLTGKRA